MSSNESKPDFEQWNEPNFRGSNRNDEMNPISMKRFLMKNYICITLHIKILDLTIYYTVLTINNTVLWRNLRISMLTKRWEHPAVNDIKFIDSFVIKTKSMCFKSIFPLWNSYLSSDRGRTEKTCNNYPNVNVHFIHSDEKPN